VSNWNRDRSSKHTGKARSICFDQASEALPTRRVLLPLQSKAMLTSVTTSSRAWLSTVNNMGEQLVSRFDGCDLKTVILSVLNLLLLLIFLVVLDHLYYLKY
jgi:hypothetical protein